MRPMSRPWLAAGLVALLLAAVTAGPSAAAPTDTTAPRVHFTTGDRSVLVAAPVGTEWTEVRGTATDIGGKGLTAVSVTYCANAWKSEHGMGCGTQPVPTVDALVDRTATLTCAGSATRRCSWAVSAPLQPGQYLVVASATDAAGNQRSTRPLFVTVV
jgi:hypothetical protein